MRVHCGMRVAVACGILSLAAVVGCKSSSQKKDGGIDHDSASIDVGSADVASPTDVATDTASPMDVVSPMDVASPMDVVSPMDVAGDASADGPAPVTGRRSFIVTSTLSVQPDPSNKGVVPLPATHTFTMVLDWDKRIAILGSTVGQGVGDFMPTAAGGGGTQTASFSLNSSSVSYQTMDVTIGASGTLSGTARGRGTSVPPNTDVGINTAVLSMSLAGVPDTQPPGFESSFFNGTPVDPFAGLTLVATEPLPPNTRLTLVDLRGERLEIAPGSTQLTAAFSFFPTQSLMWRYNDTYSLLLDGVVDFAGNARPPGGTPPSFTIGAPPILVAEDGFESATGTTLAGAQVLSGAGAPTITGARSLYIGWLSSTLPPGRAEMTQLALRISLDATDTVLRFSYRTVNPMTASTGIADPYYLLGSEGGQTTSVMLPLDTGPTTTVTLGSTQVPVGPVTTATFTLPAGAAAAGQLAFVRKVRACCGNLPGPGVTGLIIDDLRAE